MFTSKHLVIHSKTTHNITHDPAHTNIIILMIPDLKWSAFQTLHLFPQGFWAPASPFWAGVWPRRGHAPV